METTRSSETKNSVGGKWLFGLVIALLVVAAILAIWLFLGWVITKIILGSVYLVFKMFSAPFSK